MATGTIFRRTCATAVIVSCVFTVTVLPSRGPSQSSKQVRFRKGLEDPTLTALTVRQPEDRTTPVLEHSPASNETATTARAADSLEQTRAKDANDTEPNTFRTKLSISLKKVTQNVQEAEAGAGLVYVSASLPQTLPEQRFVDDLPAINQHVRSHNFTSKQAAALHAKRLKDQPGVEHASQGIVIAAGKSMRLANAYVTLRVLRDHMQSTLPVEIWYFGAEEMDANTKATLEAEFSGVTCIDASSVPQPVHHQQADAMTGYALKVFALYATSLQEVLLLDCDSMPIIDPKDAFDSLEFREHGSMFWPDLFGKGTERVPGVQPELYTLLGLQPPWVGQETDFMWAESGQLLLDRVRHADVLEYLWYLNAHADPVYKLAYGDKDTFLLAFMLAAKPQHYFQVAEWTRLCLHQRLTADSGKLEHVGIIHHNSAGSPAFLHRTSGGKLDPSNDAYFTVDLITLPLSPKRAYTLFEGAAEIGNYRYPKDRFESLATSGGHGSHSPMEQRPFQVCLFPRTDALDRHCWDDGREDLPVPVLGRDRLQDEEGDPGLASVLQASYKSFEELRGRLRRPGNVFLANLAWM